MAQQTRSNAIAPRNEQQQQQQHLLLLYLFASAYPVPTPFCLVVSAASEQRVAHLAGSQRGHNSTLLITALGTGTGTDTGTGTSTGNRQSVVGKRRPTTIGTRHPAARARAAQDRRASALGSGKGESQRRYCANIRRWHSATNKYAPSCKLTQRNRLSIAVK